jgi:hypothetical protein
MISGVMFSYFRQEPSLSTYFAKIGGSESGGERGVGNVCEKESSSMTSDNIQYIPVFL